MDIQEIADSLQPFTPVIQWGAVTQKWHVTFADWKDDVYTGDTILLALQAAQQGMHLTGGMHPVRRLLSSLKNILSRLSALATRK